MVVPRSAAMAVLALALLAWGAPPARAQRQGDAQAEKEEKRRRASFHVEEGNRYKEAGDYKRAAREYEKAYELVPHAVLFFNLGQVYRLDGDRERALEYYRRYLALEPDGVASAQARRFVKELEREITEEKARREAEETTGRGRERERERERARERERERERGREGAREGERERERESAGEGQSGGEGGGQGQGEGASDEGKTMRIAGMAAAGAGLVALGLGVKFGLDARSASNDVSNFEGPAWTDEALARQEDGKRAEKRMFIATGVGVAAVAAGAVLYYLGRKAGEEPEDLYAAPVLTGGGTGVALGGRF